MHESFTASVKTYIQILYLKTVGDKTRYAERFLALQRPHKLRLSKSRYFISYKVILKTIYTFPEDLFGLFTESWSVFLRYSFGGWLKIKSSASESWSVGSLWSERWSGGLLISSVSLPVNVNTKI